MEYQQKFWTFAKAGHIWQQRMFKPNFSKKLMNLPVFPDEILQPFVSTHDEATVPSPFPSPVEQSDEEEDAEPVVPSPPKHKGKATRTSRKGKEKMPETKESFTCA